MTNSGNCQHPVDKPGWLIGFTFSGCRVDGDGVVEIGLTGAHFYGDGEALDDLVGALTDDVNANDLFFRSLNDELEGGRFLVWFVYHAEVERLEG